MTSGQQRHRARPGVHAERVVGAAQVCLDGGLADEQGAGDVPVAEALCRLGENVALAVGERGTPSTSTPTPTPIPCRRWTVQPRTRRDAGRSSPGRARSVGRPTGSASGRPPRRGAGRARRRRPCTGCAAPSRGLPSGRELHRPLRVIRLGRRAHRSAVRVGHIDLEEGAGRSEAREPGSSAAVAVYENRCGAPFAAAALSADRRRRTPRAVSDSRVWDSPPRHTWAACACCNSPAWSECPRSPYRPAAARSPGIRSTTVPWRGVPSGASMEVVLCAAPLS